MEHSTWQWKWKFRVNVTSKLALTFCLKEAPQTWKWLMDHWTWKLGHGNPMAPILKLEFQIPGLLEEVGGWRVEGGWWIHGGKFECDPQSFSHQKAEVIITLGW